MGIVSFERREDIQNAKVTIPSPKDLSRKSFAPPPTIESDFERLLDHDIPYVNFTFELVHDWYAALKDEYEPVYIRAQQTPIDWKSKIGNSDMSTNFKVTHETPIRKGDMVIREDGIVYLLNWNIQQHPNNQATQSTECNALFEFTRFVSDETDERGILIKEAHDEIIVPSIPGVHMEYAGRPDYMASQGQPGINADHLITVAVQWNSLTKDIHVNDEFVLGSFTYRVINTSIAEVNITKDYGVLTVHAKRVAGGGIVE